MTTSVAATNLNRLLSRLDRKLPSTPAPPPLERTRIAANLEYARQLLHKLEAECMAITVPARRQKELTELGAQRQTIRRLNEALQLCVDDDNEEGEEEKEEGEGGEPELGRGEEEEGEGEEEDDYASLKKPRKRAVPSSTPSALSPPSPTAPAPGTAAQVEPPASTLRHRFAHDQKALLLGHRPPVGTSAEGVETDGDLLARHTAEQEQLAASLVAMAQTLKHSSLAFNRSLEDESAYLAQAQQGLDRNTTGMEVAGQRMDTLRRDESVSFLWSMIYLAVIVALVFLTLMVLFMAPKLRWW